MTPVRQVWHVMRKDLVQHRWFALSYIALVVLATIRAINPQLLPGAWWFPVVVVVLPLTGALLIAQAVEHDSPTQIDAFWAGHPITPAAMLGAKLSLILLVCAPALVGQALALPRFDLPASVGAGVLFRSLAIYAALLLGTLLVACFIRRTRVLGFMVLLVWILLSFGNVRIASVPTQLILVLKIAAVSALLLTSVHVYRTRDNRWRTRALGFTAVATTIFFTPATSAGEHGRELSPGIDRPVLILSYDPTVSMGDEQFLVTIAISAIPKHHRLALTNLQATIRLRDGSTIRPGVMSSPTELGRRMEAGPLPRTLVPHADTATDRAMNHMIGFHVSPAELRRIADGLASVAIEGRVLAWEAHLAGTLPMKVGSSYNQGGRRVRLEGWSLRGGEPRLTTGLEQMTAVTGDEMGLENLLGGGTRFALLDQRSREAMPLLRLGSNGTMGLMVLPGLGLHQATVEWGVSIPRSSNVSGPGPHASGDPGSPRRGDSLPEFWRRADHVAILVDVPVGGYPVRLELAIPPVGTGSGGSN